MGAYGTYAQLAIGIAGLIYSIVSQEESELPEPQELQVNNYSRNKPVPLVYGTDKVAGTCIYIGNTGAEYVEAGSGKGGFMMLAGLFIGAGPQQTPGWYYSADFCIGMCEGEAYAINNIYLNDVSLIDVLDQFSYDFERGTSTQLINSAISDFLTDGSAVPWRNTAYLWMSGQLGATNQIPTVTAEISGLLSYKAMPITNRWTQLTPARIPTSSYETGAEDWCSYHVTNFVYTNYFMNWTYQKGDNTIYVIHHDSQYNNAAMDVITISEDFYGDAFLILRISYTQPSWGGDYYFDPHNLKTRVEIIKGNFPTGITRSDNYFGFIDRSSAAYDPDSVTQCYWDMMKIDSTDAVNLDIWFSYEYCHSDTGYIRKGDVLYFFDYSFCNYVGTWYTTTDSEGHIIATGLQHAINAMIDDYGNPHIYLCPPTLETTSSSETLQPCCTKFCLEMWHTHLLYRWRVNAYPDPCIYSVVSSENPYFPNISEGGFTFPNYHRPFTAIGNNERHPKRYILCQSNYQNMTGNIEMSLWEMIGDGEHTNKILDFIVSGSYYTYGNYLQEVSIYYVGSWIYMMFNIYQSGMPADYAHKMWRYNPCTNVLERLRVPDRIFRDSHKITKGTQGNFICVSSRQDSLGDYGSHALFAQWDAFPGLGPDISPIEVCYDFMTNERYGMNIPTSLFDGSPYVSANTTWYIENMYCYESVTNDTALQNSEARFLYSRTFDEHMKGFDVIRDILQTCRGFLYYCDGKIKVKIEKGTETPVIYFGNEEVTLLADDHVAGDKDAIYIADNRPDNYWLGDLVYIFYIDGYGSMPYGVGGYGGTEIQINTEYGITTPLFTKAIVLSSTSTCLTLIENMTYEVPLDTPMIIKKDNFKKDSFKYEYKPEVQRINQVHLEYINRNDEYRTDILDYQDEYNINLTGEIREQSYTMKGIKRDTQARRMITYLADSLSYLNWSCSFDTDIVGMLLCIGDIVGVTDEINGWYGKLFRLAEMEETEDYEHKLTLMEYVPSVYHDEYIAYSQPTPIRYDDVTEQPDHVLNLKCIEDRRENKVWIGFSKPITNNTWWVGAHIYHYDPNTELWVYLGISYFNTFTAAISSSITSTQTTISFSTTHYDSNKLQSSGIIWIENEMIYYREIDDVNHRFLYCERGYKDTLAVAHSSGTCVYLRDNLYYYSYDVDNDVDKTHIFKAISVTSFGVMADGDTAPTFSILIDGNYLLPFPVGNLICYELE